ncbi:MAG TPA: N-acetylmuramoyl-L-alanine amidase [Terriglobales bacterium]|nr:N-acetylmuramoyl-L-alanine amidase [Terriglobales bacterium]
MLWLCVIADSAEDKQLSVYAPQATFVLRVVDQENREYVDLQAVLAPISKINAKIEGDAARFIGGIAEGLFLQGESSARVGQKRVRFPGKIIIVDGKVLIPLVAVPALLQEMAGLRSELHEAGRRLFVENTQSRFSVEVKSGEASEMLLAFPVRVTPIISQEGNRVRLVFRQEPVVMTGDKITFTDSKITALHFEEKNGVAEITVDGIAPLLVGFADQGKTLSIRLAPAAAAAPAPPPAEAQPAAQPPAATTTPPVAPPAAASSPFPFDSVRYVVMIDPGHGGNDPGVRFSDKVVEKDITLALAKRLRTELQNRGVPALLAREADATLSNDQRASAANAQRAALFVTLHAGGLGSGVRVYATVMPKAEPVEGPFVPWQRAQESYRERSILLARAVANEISGKKVPARMFSAPVPPLHAVAAPAIAVEVAPPSVGAPVEDFGKAAYQQAIVVAIANAIVNTRSKLEQMR